MSEKELHSTCRYISKKGVYNPGLKYLKEGKNGYMIPSWLFILLKIMDLATFFQKSSCMIRLKDYLSSTDKLMKVIFLSL